MKNINKSITMSLETSSNGKRGDGVYADKDNER